jgi:hypothetical protein
MRNAPTPDQVLAALSRWHVKTVKHTGWRTRGRPASTGEFGPLIGVVNHHTADKGKGKTLTALRTGIRAIMRVLIKGRADLPGPLCHFSTDRLGQVHLVAMGRANHAGAFAANTVADTRAGRAPGRPGPVDSVDGNRLYWGNEVHNDGLGEDYTDAQVEAVIRLNAALIELSGWSSNAAIQHKEGTRRKSDMSKIDGHESGAFVRQQVALALSVGPERYGYPDVKPAPHKDTRPALYLAKIQAAWRRKSGRGAFMGVRAIQRGLHRAGYLNGYVPGVAGRKTKAAYAKWAGANAHRVPSKSQVRHLVGPGYVVR